MNRREAMEKHLPLLSPFFPFPFLFFSLSNICDFLPSDSLREYYGGRLLEE